MLARCYSENVYSIPAATWWRMNYEVVEYDPYGLVTTGVGAWAFTANHDGFYLAKAALLWGNIDWGNVPIYLNVYKNGANYACLDRWQTNLNAAARYIHQHGHDMVWLNEGEDISFWIRQNDGVARSTYYHHDYNYCAIFRM